METKHIAFFNFLESFKEGCPFCVLIKKSIDKSMHDFLYERVNDPLVRQKIRKSLSFCNRHSWQLQEKGNSLGQAIIYSDILELILEKIEMDKQNIIEKREICIFCREEKEILEHYVNVFWKNFSEPEFIAKYKRSFGFCLPHLFVLIKKNKNLKLSKELLALEKEKLSELNNDLKEFIRKYDWRFSKEEFGKEKDAWIKAIEKIIGKRN